MMLTGTEMIIFFLFRYNNHVRVENIPKTKNAPKCPKPLRTLQKKSLKSFIKSSGFTSKVISKVIGVKLPSSQVAVITTVPFLFGVIVPSSPTVAIFSSLDE